MFRRFWGVAQSVEQRTLIPQVGGSNPPSPTGYAGSSPAAAPGQRDAAGSRIGVLTVPHPDSFQSQLLYGKGWDRRQVLRGLLALPLVKHFLPPVGGWPVGSKNLPPLRTFEKHSIGWTDWRGILGTSGDGVALVSAAHPLHPMSAAAFRAAVLPGLNKIFSESYDNYAGRYEEIYGSQQLTLFNEVDPIEEIEIEIRPPADAAAGLGSLLQEERVAIASIGRELTHNSERARRLFESLLLGSGGKTLK